MIDTKGGENWCHAVLGTRRIISAICLNKVNNRCF